jgi:hypothetical protein
MSRPGTPPLPAVLLANDLRIGDVVFAGSSGWTRDLDAALVAVDASSAADLVQRGEAGLAARDVVDVQLVEVAIEGGRPIPKKLRERLKVFGPSVRPDLGRQASLSGGPAKGR